MTKDKEDVKDRAKGLYYKGESWFDRQKNGLLFAAIAVIVALLIGGILFSS